jgi:general secretion pathway protein H
MRRYRWVERQATALQPGGLARSAERGFTLIETIVVLVILGLALTVVAGFLPRRNTTLELTAATSRVTGALRIARSRAMVEGHPVPFATAPDGHGFRLENAQVNFGPGVTVVMAQPRILFAPDGSTSGGSLRVVVGGKQRQILVDWLTGRVVVVAAS